VKLFKSVETIRGYTIRAAYPATYVTIIMTLLVNALRPIFHAMGVRVTREMSSVSLALKRRL
jgi:hypothetical protein